MNLQLAKNNVVSCFPHDYRVTEDEVLGWLKEGRAFTMPLRIVQTFPGLPVGFVRSDQPSYMVPCYVTEERYKLDDNYKVGFEPEVNGFEKQTYYISDLVQLVRSGHVIVAD